MGCEIYLSACSQVIELTQKFPFKTSFKKFLSNNISVPCSKSHLKILICPYFAQLGKVHIPNQMTVYLHAYLGLI